MVRLKNFSGYRNSDIPDHILQEIVALTEKMSGVLFPLIKRNDPNIVLAALTHLHCATIKMLVSEEPGELKKASELQAVSILKNMETLINMEENASDNF